MQPVLSERYYLKSHGKGYALIKIDEDRTYDISNSTYEILKQCDGTKTLEQMDSHEKINFETLKSSIEKLHQTGIVSEGQVRENLCTGYYKGPLLKGLGVHITSRCNLACKHCYATEFNNAELFRENLEKLAYDAAAIDTHSISLTGGETFLRPDIVKMFSDIGYTKGMRIENVFSNGTMLSNHTDLLKELKERFETVFYVSIEGTEDAFEKFRNTKRRFKNYVKGLESIAAIDGSLVANIFWHKENYKNVVDVYDFLKQWGNLVHVRFGTGLTLGEWKKNRTACGVTLQDEVGSIVDFLRIWDRDGRPFSVEYGHIFRYTEDKWFTPRDMEYGEDSLCCEYFRDNAMIYPNGDVCPCYKTWPNYVCGNVVTESLESVWRSEKMRTFKEMRLRQVQLPECDECVFLKQCGKGCRGNASKSDNYGIYGMDHEICNIFKGNIFKKLYDFIDR